MSPDIDSDIYRDLGITRAGSYLKLKLRCLKELTPKYYDDCSIRNYEKKASRLQMRFESSFHNPLIDEIDKELERSDFEITTMGDKRVSNDIILPGRFKRIYVEEEHGIPFLGGKDIMQFDPPEMKYLSLKGHSERIDKELRFQKNMVLITCSGTVGNVVLAPEHFNGWTGSQHIIRIIPNDQMNPGYLNTYFASEYGNELIRRNIYGSVVDEINDAQVARIPIPLPPPDIMDEIGELVMIANKKRTEAFHLEKKAIKTVEEFILKNQQ